MAYRIMNEQILPPHDISAEELVIACLLLDGEMIREIKTLEWSDFYSEQLSQIYKICVELYQRGQIINQITIGEEEERLNKSDKLGGVAYLSHLLSIASSPYDTNTYADIVHNYSLSRQLITLGEQCTKIGYEANPDNKQSIQTIYDMITDFKKKHMTFEGIVSPKEASSMMLDFIREYKDKPKTLKWGYRDLDSITSGIYPDELIIIGARPSVGKTQLMLDIMENLSTSGKNILFCSAEMSLKHILERRIARELGVSILELRQKRISDDEEKGLLYLIGENASRSVYYMRKGTSSDDILNEATKMKDNVGLDIVFIDYLQFLSDCWQSTGENQNVRVGKASKTLKLIANELNIPVVVASQLNRGLEHRGEGDKHPTLADLRDSGNIEQDADVVFLLDRIIVKEPNGNEDNTRLSVKMAKNRQIGSMPAVELRYDLKTRRYVDCEMERRSQELPKLIEEEQIEFEEA